MTNTEKIVAVLALALGVLFAWVDSRPGWDDTGVMAVLVLVTAGLLALAAPRRPWRWGLAVGAWIPLAGIVGSRNYGSLLALALAMAGAYAGMGVRRALAA